MRMRRAALLVMLAAGLMISTTASVGAETAQKAPPGFKTVKVKKAGFSVATPKSWATVDITQENADALLDNIRDAAPDLAAQLPSNISDLVAQSMVLISFSDETVDDFTPNLNVLLFPGVSDNPTIEEIELELGSIAEDAEFSEVTVAGQDAVKAEYDLSSGDIQAHLIQYVLTGPKGGLVITFTTAQGASTDDFDKILKSVKLLKR